MATEEDIETKPERIIYAGKRLSAKNTLLFCYVRESEPDVLLAYAKRVGADVSVGTIIQRNVLEDGRFYSAGPFGPKTVGRYQDQERINAWVAESSAMQANKARDGIAKRSSSQLERSIGVLADAYSKQRGQERAGFLAWIMAEVTK